MARTGLEQHQVFKTADKLQASGTEPTIQGIRDALGTGSFATISTHLKAWRTLKAQQSPIPEQPDSFRDATNAIWASAWGKAEESFKEEKKALKLEKEGWEREKEGMLNEIERLEKMMVGEQSQREKLEKELTEAKSEGKKAISENHSLREKVAGLSASLKATEERRKEALERSDRLEKELAAIAQSKALRKK